MDPKTLYSTNIYTPHLVLIIIPCFPETVPIQINWCYSLIHGKKLHDIFHRACAATRMIPALTKLLLRWQMGVDVKTLHTSGQII